MQTNVNVPNKVISPSSQAFSIGDQVVSNADDTILFDVNFNKVRNAPAGRYLGTIQQISDNSVQVKFGLDESNNVDNAAYWVMKDHITKTT